MRGQAELALCCSSESRVAVPPDARISEHEFSEQIRRLGAIKAVLSLQREINRGMGNNLSKASGRLTRMPLASRLSLCDCQPSVSL